MHQIFLSCRAVIILTFPGRWFSYVGNALGSTRHCRHCTLGCIAYSRLLCRFSLLGPLSRAPGTQSRRPSSLNGSRLFRHLQLRYFTEKELYGVWSMVGVHWTVLIGCFMSSCCRDCGLGLLSFPVTLIISLMMSSYSTLYGDVLYILLLYVQIRAQYFFPSWKRWVALKLLELAIRERGQLELKEKKKKPLVDMFAIVAKAFAAVCQLYLRLWNTTLATWKLYGHKAYTDMHCSSSTL